MVSLRQAQLWNRVMLEVHDKNSDEDICQSTYKLSKDTGLVPTGQEMHKSAVRH